MVPIDHAKSWMKEKIVQGIAAAKKNKLKATAGLLVVSLFATGSALASHYYNANTSTLYQVVVDGKELGLIDDPEVVKQYITQKITEEKHQLGTDHVQLANRIEYTEEESRGRANNQGVLAALQKNIELKVAAQALIVNGQVVGYADRKETIDSVMNEILGQYGPLPVANDKKQTVKMASVPEEDKKPLYSEQVKIKEDVEVKAASVEASKLLTKDELKKLLVKGSLEEVKHTVKEGDCISCIAAQYDITTEDIYRSNPGINEDTLLQLGDQITVTAYQPKVTVQTVIEKQVEEPIDYPIKTEANEDLYRGQTKVVQQGKEGLKQVTYKVIKENGVVSEKTVLDKKVLREAIPKIVERGTKVKPDRGDGSFTWPTYGGRITSNYGSRWGRLHKGIDISGVSNKTIKAADNGKVTLAGWNGNYGNCVIIDHGNGYQTVYGHLSSISVSVGDTVEKGEKIGVMGSTGDSTGTHLHFEIKQNGKITNPIKFLRG